MVVKVSLLALTVATTKKTKGAITWKKVAKMSKHHCDGTDNINPTASEPVGRACHIAWDYSVFDNQGETGTIWGNVPTSWWVLCLWKIWSIQRGSSTPRHLPHDKWMNCIPLSGRSTMGVASMSMMLQLCNHVWHILRSRSSKRPSRMQHNML